MKKIFTASLVCLFLFGFINLSASIVGQTTGATGTSATYTSTGVVNCAYWSVSWPQGQITYQDATTVTISWLATGTATIQIIDGCTGIPAATKTVSVSQGACSPNTPTATFSFSPNTCGNRTITYTGTPSSGATWYWQTTFGGTSTSNSTSTFVTTVEVDQGLFLREYLSCGQWSTNSQSTGTVFINPIPGLPSGSNVVICGAGVVNFNTTPGSNANTVRWYDSASGGTLLATSTSYSPTISTNTIYYISSYNSTTGCESGRTGLAASVNPIPSLASAGAVSICGSGFVNMTAAVGANGSTVRWYTAPGSGLVNTGQTYAPTIFSTTTYYITSYNYSTSCESGFSTVTATVNPIPGGATASGAALCASGTPTLTAIIGANANTARWYDAPSGGNLISTGLTYSPTVSATTNYYLTSYNTTTGCESTSPRWTVTVTVYPTTNAGLVTSNQLTEAYGVSSATLTLNGFVGNIVKWQKQVGTTITDSGNTTDTYLYSNLNNTTQFRAVVQSGVCAFANSPWFTVNIYNIPAITYDGPVNIAAGGTTGVHTTTGYFHYEWLKGGSAFGQTNPSLTIYEPATYSLRVQQTSTSPTYTTGNIVIGESIANQYVPVNYVSSKVFLKAGVSDNTNLFTLASGEVSQQVQYIDGLGREMQTVRIGTSPAGKDLIQPVEYDAFGRNPIQYLPYAGAQRDGRYSTTAIRNTTYTDGDQYLFYQNVVKGAHDINPYSETNFEPSPLNRPDKQYGAGQNWRVNNKYIQHSYLINADGTSTGQERIIAWTVTGNMPVRMAAITGSVVTGGYYASSQLNIKSTFDEEGREVREYTDSHGHTILKKVQYVNTPTLSNKDHWAQTYYVYDDLGNLRFVIPPELTKIIYQNDAYNPTTPDLANWAFQYQYDGRKRMIQKQVPGADPVYMIYDLRDRVVMTQDGNQRAAKKWLFTKYDVLNRPILTGIYEHASIETQASMTALVSTTNFSETYNGVASTHGYTNTVWPTSSTTILTATYFDNYNFKSLVGENMDYVNSDIIGQPSVEFTRVTGQVTGSKVNIVGTTNFLYSVTYFDDKYRALQTISQNHLYGTDRKTNKYDFAGKVLSTLTTHTDSSIDWKDVVGVTTGPRSVRKTSSLGWGNAGVASVQSLPANTDGWIEWTATELASAKMIGFSATNANADYASIGYCFTQYYYAALGIYESGTSRIGYQAYANGDVMRIQRVAGVVSYYKNGVLVYTSTVPSTTALLVDMSFYTESAGVQSLRASWIKKSNTVLRTFDYDHAGRLLKTWHSINSASPVLLSQNEYNELGQLIDKKLYSTNNGATFKQSEDYRYNIRGWLTKINESDVSINEAGDPRDLFGMELLYDQADGGIGNTAAFNGNISAMKWSKDQSLGTKKENAYSYGYDPLSRISSATFKEKSGAWGLATSSAFSESGYAYDMNGNIQALLRYDKRGSGMALDNLVYNYGAVRSNKLMKVTDNGDDFAGFVDGTNSGDDYTYDLNGNMLTDQNKGITTSIGYNHLNLPVSVLKGGSSVFYMYDALGRKLAQIVYYADSQKQTDYSGEYQYENDVLQFINHEEGRAVVASVKNVFTDDGSTLNNFTASNVTLSNVTLNGTETYVKAVSTSTTSVGVFPIGGIIPVVAGERYKVRAKGYRLRGTAGHSDEIYLITQSGGANLESPGPILPLGSPTANTESWIETTVTIPPGATTLTAGLWWGPLFVGEEMYINDFEITKLTTNATPEYQFNLKDHLGNVRVTFTTKTDVDASVGTYETANAAAEQSQFTRYSSAKRVNSVLLDHTHFTNAGAALTISNYDFSATYSPLASNGTMDLSLFSNALRAVSNGPSSYVYFHPSASTEGHRYKLTFDISFSGTPITVATYDQSESTDHATGQLNISSSGTYSYQFTAISSSAIIKFMNGSSHHDFYLDNVKLEDLTPAGTGSYSERLNGSANEKYGLARSLSVMPGDTLKMEVYAKYLDTNSSNWTAALNTLVTQVAANTAGVVIDGAGYNSSTASFPTGYAGAVGNTDNGAPKAYLNWLIFDREFMFITGGFKQITTAALESGTGSLHEKIAPSPVVITQSGYVYVYLSNEETTYTREVYFDDFKVTHVKSPVIQTDDYYPGGAMFNSFVRENSTLNNFKYQSKEFQTELGLELYDFGRPYDPWRMQTITQDAHAENYLSLSPYSWAANNPLKYVDPNGKDVVLAYTVNINGKDFTQKVTYEKGNLLNADGSKYAGSNAYFKNVQKQLNEIKGLDKGVSTMVEGLENSESTHVITYNEAEYKEEGAGNKGTDIQISQDEKGETKISQSTETNFNPYDTKTIRGDKTDPRSTLAHELKHASDRDKDTMKEGSTKGVPNREIDAVKVENKINKALKLPERTTYQGKKIN